MVILRRVSTSVSLAFGNQVPLENIRAHGARTSDAVWPYVKHKERAASVVRTTLASHFA